MTLSGAPKSGRAISRNPETRDRLLSPLSPMKEIWRILHGDNEHAARRSGARGLPMDSLHAVGFDLLSRGSSASSEPQGELQACRQALRDLAVELTRAEERERHRLASALHDGVSQDLSAVTLKVGLLTGSAPSEQLREALAGIEKVLVELGTSLTSLTFELCPPVLYERGLEAALAWLVDRFRRRTAIGIRLVTDGLARPLDVAHRSLLFQIARELLTNVVKHAQATRAVVTVAETPSGVSLGVEDDGVGFDPVVARARAKEDVGFGLFSIRQRLSHLGGLLEVASGPGRGSRLVAVVPD